MNLYLAYSNGKYGPDFGNALRFDDACDCHLAHLKDGIEEASVFRIEPVEGGAAPMLVDVTDDAIARLKRIHDMDKAARHEPYPEWLDGGESAAQAAQWAAEDAAHERQERSQLEVL